MHSIFTYLFYVTVCNMNRIIRCNVVVRWHFKIYFSLRKTSPPQLVSFAVLHFRIDSSLQVEEEGSKRNFVLPNPPPQDGLLACGRELWLWGTRLHPAVEMAVSIKYHFQFPCFMIPGLLSTNNLPQPPQQALLPCLEEDWLHLSSPIKKTFTWK